MTDHEANRRAKYQTRKEQGLCPRCGKKVKRKDKTSYCADCLAYFRQKAHETAEEKEAKKKQNKRVANPLKKIEDYHAAKEEHKCPRCGKTIPGNNRFVYCEECLGIFREYNFVKAQEISQKRKAEREERKANHCCTRCGKKLPKYYRKTRCTDCLDKTYFAKHKKKRPAKANRNNFEKLTDNE